MRPARRDTNRITTPKTGVAKTCEHQHRATGQTTNHERRETDKMTIENRKVGLTLPAPDKKAREKLLKIGPQCRSILEAYERLNRAQRGALFSAISFKQTAFLRIGELFDPFGHQHIFHLLHVHESLDFVEHCRGGHLVHLAP